MKYGVSTGPELEQIREMPESFDFVEISVGEREIAPEEIDVEELKNDLEEKGYDLVVHLPFRQPLATSVERINDANIEYLGELIEFCSELDAKKAVVHINVRYGEEIENVEHSLERAVKRLMEKGREEDVRIVFEHIPFSDSQGYNLKEFGEAMERLGAPICLDTGHAYVDDGQEGLEDFLSRHLDMISHLHIQDSMGGDDHVSVGHGEIDWESFGTLVGDFEGTATLELFTDEPRYFELSREIIEENLGN